MKLKAASGPDNQPDSKSLRCMSRSGPSVTSCALFTKMSIVPKALTTVSTVRAMSASTLTLPGMASARPPRCSISATVASSFSGVRPVMATAAPSAGQRERDAAAHALAPHRSRSRTCPRVSAWSPCRRPERPERPFERNAGPSGPLSGMVARHYPMSEEGWP